MSYALPPLDPAVADAPGPAWCARLLGEPGLVRQAVLRLLWLLPSYALALVMLALAVHLERSPLASAMALAAYVVGGLLTFYALLRSGWAARRREPTLAFPQMVFGAGAVVLAYALVPCSRPLALEWLCLMLVFDMHRLQRQQVRRVLLLTILGLSLVVAQELWWHGRQATLNRHVAGELINLGLASLSLPLFVFVSSLARRLRLQSARQHRDLQQALARRQALVVRDGLTHAFTRHHLQTLIEQEAARQRRTQRLFCLAMLDIDHFKLVNDHHGHLVGDAVLKAFTQLAQTAIGPGHALGRWGGEEFLLLMPETPLPEALATLQRLRTAVHHHDWSAIAAGLTVTFSAGVSQHLPADKAPQVIERADRALYEAKQAGRDRIKAALDLPRARHREARA